MEDTSTLTIHDEPAFKRWVDQIAEKGSKLDTAKQKLKLAKAAITDALGIGLKDEEERIEAMLVPAKAFALANKDTLFAKKKTYSTDRAVCSIRKGKEAVVLEDDVEEADVVAALKEKGLLSLLNVTTTLDKVAINKVMQTDPELASWLTARGIVLSSETAFKVTLKP